MKSPWTRCFALVVTLALTAAACSSDGVETIRPRLRVAIRAPARSRGS